MKKFISLFTALSIVFSILGTFTVFADETAADITEISTLAELEAFRDDVNGGNTYEGKTVTLTADIDLSSICGADINGEEVSWTPIGYDSPFNGTFDGAGHTVSGLYINSEYMEGAGLFGRCEENSQILNLVVDGTVTVGYPTMGVVAPIAICGIVGFNAGKIANCHNKATITGIGNCVYAAGICGFPGGVSMAIENCINTGVIVSEYKSEAIMAFGSNSFNDNCYYLEGTSVSGSGAEPKTAEQFASGEVAYLLGDEWRQKIGTDEYPVIGGDKVYLADGEYTNIPQEEKHTHKVCGGENCADNHEDIEWTAWNRTDRLPTEAGNYYLTKDIELIEVWAPETGINLCLNGHIVACHWYKGSPDSAFIFFDLTDTVTLTDCSDTEHKFSVGDNGQWEPDEDGTKTLKGGVVINPNGYYAIQAVAASLDMYNINIAGSNGAIWATESLNMYNCTLAGNSYTAALNARGPVTMRDCSIFENTGGAVSFGEDGLNIGGKMLISDNVTYRGDTRNVFFEYSSSITIGAPLTDGSYIGIYSDYDATKESPLTITGANDADYSKYFHCDDKNYKIINGENNSIQLIYDKGSSAYPYTVTQITAFNLDTGYPTGYIPKNKEFAVSINVHKNTELDEYTFIICALYDADGALMGVYPSTMKSSSEIITYAEIIPAQDKKVGSIKAFVWDSYNSMEPLSEAKIQLFM